MILCCGEALIDMIPEPTIAGGEGFVPHTGGAVFNTAIALGRLGAGAGLLTGLSTDMFGDQLRQDLQASGVDGSYAITSDRPTTLAFVKLENGQAEYTFNDENSAGRMLQAADLPALNFEVSALFFGGISLACEPCADTYAALLEAESKSRVVMMDPNIRQSFIQDVAKYRARLDRMMAQVDVCKVSDEDLDWIVEGSASLEDKASTLLDKGPSLIIVTKGGDGATAYHKNAGSVHVQSKRVTVVDTVGAGDTFNAGVLASFAQQGVLTKEGIQSLSIKGVEQALDLGATCAAITVSRKGANPPWANEI